METIKFNELPAIGEALDGGHFAGLTTTKDGKHCAVVKLHEQGADLEFEAAKAWAAALGAELPSRPVAALLFANLRPLLQPRWHWLNEEYEHDASYAWYCYFYDGTQYDDRKSSEGSAVAVRLIQLSA